MEAALVALACSISVVLGFCAPSIAQWIAGRVTRPDPDLELRQEDLRAKIMLLSDEVRRLREQRDDS